MTPRSFLLTAELTDYVRAGSEPPDEVARDLLAETALLAERGEVPPTFQIPLEQGVFMQLLTRALGVRRAIEIGTFTGFSALCIARGLPDDGSLLCLDRNEEWTAIARRYWARAGLADRIELRLGDALPTLQALPAVETFDLAFVDADKTGYAGYVEELYPRMRANGVVLLDNTLRSGRVFAPETDDDRAVVALNAALPRDPRWETVLLPMSDGLTMLRKR
ncbi:MAG TPA: O-methyltransferase [Blastococcus sp.]|jgi:caffeoyl-CoA O-methyltransferase|nr:O-methyltransferase [Blastococcus sp.]